MCACLGYGCGPHPPASPDPKPWAEPSPAIFFQLSSHHLQEAFPDCRSEGARALSARQTHAQPRPIQAGCPSSPWELPPTLLVTWTPGPRAGSMGKGAAAEPKPGCHQGTLGVNGKRPLPPQPGAGSAESRWGRRASSSRQTAGMWGGGGVGGPGTQGPAREAVRNMAQHQRWGWTAKGRGTGLWVRA